MQKILAILTVLLMITLATEPAAASEVTSASLLESLRSEAVILMEADSGQILFEKNMHQVMYPASITKVATAMLALQLADPDDVITMSRNAVFSVGRDTSHIALDTDEQITMEQALYALALASANDAANGVAEQIGGSIEGFAEMMNQAAAQAGAKNTHFTNPHGLPDDNHVTTAYDMAKITAAALKTPGFIEIFGSKLYEIAPTNKQPETRFFSSRNKFTNGEIACEGVLFSKTGWTRRSEATLVTAVRRNGTTLIAVVMKTALAADNYRDTVTLFDYGFSQFTNQTIIKSELAQKNIAVLTGQDDIVQLDFFASEDAAFLLPGDKTLVDVAIVCGKPEVIVADNQARLPVQVTLKGGEASDETRILANIFLTAQLPVQQITTNTDSSSVGSLADTPPGGQWIVIFPILILMAALGLLAREISRRKRRRRRGVRRH